MLMLVASAMLGGCSGDPADTPPTPPTAADVAQFVSGTRQPAYWLGADVRGATVSDIRVSDRGTALSYGEWSCDPGSGCSDPGGVSTGRRSASLADLEVIDGAASRDCWSRIGKAVAVLDGCIPDGYPQLLLIYSGTLEISVTSIYTRDGQGEISARAAARRLRPVNSKAPWPLPAPEPLSCAAFKRIDPGVRRHMPRPLRPVCRP